MNIYEELNPIFRRVFDDDEITLRAETSANDIEGWDSLSHTTLVVAIEKHFQVKFSTGEILRWKNVGQMAVSIAEKIEQKG